MRFSHQTHICELCSTNDGKKLGTAESAILNPKGTNRHPFPMNEAITPHSGVGTHPTARQCSLNRSVVTFQLSAWPSNRWELGQLAGTQSQGTGAKFWVWVSINRSNVLGKKTSSSKPDRLWGRTATQILLPYVWI